MLKAMRPMTSSQTKASPKGAKNGMKPGKLVGIKAAPKTKLVKKATPKVGKKMTGHAKGLLAKGKPISKKMPIRKVKAR